MKSASSVRATVLTALLVLAAVPAFSQSGSSSQTPRTRSAPSTVRVAGIVRDEANAIALPGIPVEVVDTNQVVYTDVDGRYIVDLPPGEHELKVTMDGYQPKTIKVTAGDQRNVVLDVALAMTRFAENVTVIATAIDVPTSTAEAQLIVRRQAQVITDNLGAQEMKQNGDSDAAAAMARVTGLSVVDNQYVFVRGLGERYSNTTLAGSVLPTTEPDKKVVPTPIRTRPARAFP